MSWRSWRSHPPVASEPVPADLQVQFDQLLNLAAARGSGLNPGPHLEIDASRPDAAESTGGASPVVRLGTRTAGLPPADRGFLLAHELSHIRRQQRGLVPPFPRAAFGAWSLVMLAVWEGVILVSAGWAPRGGLGVALAWWAVRLALMLGAAAWGLLGVVCSYSRREEAAVDHLTAVLFGEVLTVDGVERLTGLEERLNRALPDRLRSHPRPAARRAAGLRAIDSKKETLPGPGAAVPLRRHTP